MRNTVIAGIDPGVTTGIAVIDTQGNVLSIYSKRNIARSDIISHILKFGTPVVISSDVRIMPRSVEKIATKLGCIAYSPDLQLRINDKRNLTKDYYDSIKNDHETDALSAAIKAWKNYRSLFSKVNDVLKNFGRPDMFAKVVSKVVKEETPNIGDALRELIESESSPKPAPQKQNDNQKEFVNKLQKKLVEKQQKIDLMMQQNVVLSQALNESRKKSKDANRVQMKNNYNDFGNETEYLKKLRKIENRGYYPIIEIENSSVDSIEDLHNRIDLENRVVIMKKNENLHVFNGKNIKCMLAFGQIGDVDNIEFPIVQIEENEIEDLGIKAVKTDYIERKILDARKSGLIGWLKGYRKRKE